MRVQSTICWQSSCGQLHVFVCTPARHVFGTELLKILGTPVGSPQFVQGAIHTRLEDEAKLWDAITWVPDLQSSWQILLQCVGPRCHHLLRTLPPSQSAYYAAEHDEGMQRTMWALLGDIPGGDQEKQDAARLATLPMRMGGLGFRSAVRMAPAAHWASWADALPMLLERLPVVAQNAVNVLDGDVNVDGCLGEVRQAAAGLDRQGFIGRPQWGALQMGARPPPSTDSEPGEWAHGWHHYAASAFAQSCPSHQAHLRSHSGSGCSHVLHGCPTRPEFKIEPGLFRVLILERLPLPVTEARCECGVVLDCRGRHRAACPHSGRLRTRALAPERTHARVCREAGATVRCNAKLVDMNIAVPGCDERAMEVLASGLPLFHGAQLAVDITLRCVLTTSGMPRPGAAAVNGIVCAGARVDKERKYTELLSGDRCRLVVMAMETGGRWSSEAVEFVDNLAAARAREAPPLLQRSVFLAWRRRYANARRFVRKGFRQLSCGTHALATCAREC